MNGINISTDNVNSQVTVTSDKNLPVKNSPSAVQPSDEVQTDKVATEAVMKMNDSEQQDKGLMTSEQLEKVAQKLQDFVGEMNKGLEFSVDKDSGRDVIKVIDKNSGDLIKQYPTEEVLDLVAKLSEATGNFINTDA